MDANDRERLSDMRRRFIRQGINALAPQEVLELLFSYVSPCADNYGLSYRLLKEYGSLDSLISSSFHQLRAVGELDEARAFFLTLVNRVGRQALLEEMEARTDAFPYSTDMGRYFLELVRGEPREAFYELCMDGNAFLACYQLTNGGALSLDMEPRRELTRRTLEGALKSAANGVALCHCISGGVAAPTLTDRVTAWKIGAALKSINVTFRDYFIVTDDDFTSLSEIGLLGVAPEGVEFLQGMESGENADGVQSTGKAETMPDGVQSMGKAETMPDGVQSMGKAETMPDGVQSTGKAETMPEDAENMPEDAENMEEKIEGEDYGTF